MHVMELSMWRYISVPGFISDGSPGSSGLPDLGWDFQLEVPQKYTLLFLPDLLRLEFQKSVSGFCLVKI